MCGREGIRARAGRLRRQATRPTRHDDKCCLGPIQMLSQGAGWIDAETEGMDAIGSSARPYLGVCLGLGLLLDGEAACWSSIRGRWGLAGTRAALQRITRDDGEACLNQDRPIGRLVLPREPLVSFIIRDVSRCVGSIDPSRRFGRWWVVVVVVVPHSRRRPLDRSSRDRIERATALAES